ncbi:MAG: ribonuclease H-like domain-containing protein [Candidatus Promineifilaceae bacterium]
MNSKLQNKLKRLGVTKGIRNLVTPPPKPSPTRANTTPHLPLEKQLPGGRVESNELGDYFVVDTVYPLTYQHGSIRIESLLEHSPNCFNPYLKQKFPHSFRDCLFIDTETTGLAGAGTIAFMVGVGFFERDALVVRQYFVRDFGEEAAMLFDLDLLVAEYPTLISFNGKTFDIPLLKTRYLMNRLEEPFSELPHIDLLHPARRVWRRRLGSVALGALEVAMLGVERTHQDVPGALIPMMYHDYVRTGDPAQMLRVFYHNKLDIVSMATLAAQLIRTITEPDLCNQVLDVYGLARWQVALGLPTAEAYLRQAAAMDCETEVWHEILLEIGRLLKRQKRRTEAIPLWLQVAHTTTCDVAAHIELAKIYEWHDVDLKKALHWTKDAINMLDPDDIVQFDELNHRFDRLIRKISVSR